MSQERDLVVSFVMHLSNLMQSVEIKDRIIEALQKENAELHKTLDPNRSPATAQVIPGRSAPDKNVKAVPA